MKESKPILQQVNPFLDTSIVARSFSHPDQNIYKYWHYHRELEIIYINKGSGKKYVCLVGEPAHMVAHAA